MGRLELQNLTIKYNTRPVILELSAAISEGELVSLLGPSGVGKTTILKTIAGLLPPASGAICINGERIDHLAAEKRDVVLIFQKPLLFPFLDVFDNIGFGLKMAKTPRSMAKKRIDRIMQITGLEKLKNRRIHQLSGGQQQRVALARGLVLEPSVLLLDEPLSSLDAELRRQMRELICTVQSQTGTTMLFVTHDQSEALAISDRIYLLLDGRLRQSGTPAEVFYRPADVEVARFFGCSNFIAGQIQSGIFRSGDVRCSTVLSDSPDALAVIRPEDIVLCPGETDEGLSGKIIQIQFEGPTTRLTIDTGHTTFTALTARPTWTREQVVRLQFPPDRMHILPSTLR